MYKVAIVFCIAAVAAGPVAASDKSDVMAVIHQWVDGFNKADTKAMIATCADQVAIIDDIPPNEWHGAGACSTWVSAFEDWSAKNAITEGNVAPGKTRHISVEGKHAYVVIPMTFSYKDHGKAMKETGAVATMSLAKGDSGWRISGWSWSSGMTAAASTDGGH
ncbi:MAG TPA: nuclear transport factor 2 family protein [Steroidobacteraceae bacterium]|nr:nuclear transport factor 2 family protein [Steroidobacteraceae bacterium]